MIEGIHTFTKTGRMRRASYADVCNWIVECWKEITPQCIKNGFKCGGLHDYGDSNDSQSNENNCDTDDEESDEEFDPSLTQFSEILEAFHTESDEDFDGFD